MQNEQNLTQQEQQLIKDIAGISMSLSICKAVYHGDVRILCHMPFTYYPYLIKLETYNTLKEAHYIWQKLFVKISHNSQFLTKLAQKFCLNDEYLQKLLNIYKKSSKDVIGIACTRVDYMGDTNPALVQYNIMSVGLNAMSDRVQTLHSVMNKYKQPVGRYTYPQCHNQQVLCRALISAVNRSDLANGLIIMIVHQKQFNYGDHNAFRLQLLKQGKISSTFTMDELINKMEYNEETRIASVNGRNIAAFYFRTGYTAKHFPTQTHWNLREKIELSKSIKFPSIDMIMINSKRLQSELAKPDILKLFLSEYQTKKLVTLAGEIHDFDSKTEQEIEDLLQKTKISDYVLKPNREGGGNNFFGEKAYLKLKQLKEEHTHLANYILMKKIKSQSYSTHFIVEEKPIYVSKAVAQFSTLGCFIYKNGQILLNEFGGTLVRVKREDSDEGGIAVGLGAISGVCIDNFNGQ